MKLSVFGLGYVGCVTAACLAHQGCRVIGVDISPMKVGLVNAGRSPVVEPDLEGLLSQAVETNQLWATTDVREAVDSSDLALLCVGTPPNPDGSQDLSALHRVCQDIGQVLAHRKSNYLVVVRSTVFPGTIERVVIPTLEGASGKKVGKGFHVIVNPEFLREGSSIHDFQNPPFIVIGEYRENDANLLEEMYSAIVAPCFKTDIRTAEMVKYACNAFHTLKIAFANEMGRLCQALDINPLELMRIFVADTKLNLSSAYLRPGMAFGGSCLPKDLRAVLHEAENRGVWLPMLSAILPSNQAQIVRGVNLIDSTGKKNVGVIGISFKDGTDDLRESVMVKMVRILIDKGLNVRVYDEAVNLAFLLGANREFMEHELPELPSLLTKSLEEVITQSEVLVVSRKVNPDLSEIARLVREDQVIVDLVGVEDLRRLNKGKYIGICW